MRIFTFDTTLRDGTQGEAVSFSADDKVLVAHKLDELGIDYIEGGWPGSNPKDKDFFARAKSIAFKHARLTAFGATRMARNTVEDDASVNALIEAGHAGGLHLRQELGSARAPGPGDHRGRKPAADLRHRALSQGARQGSGLRRRAFLRRLQASREFALRTLEAAKEAGADALALCDTNGGTMTERARGNLRRRPQELRGGPRHPHA